MYMNYKSKLTISETDSGEKEFNWSHNLMSMGNIWCWNWLTVLCFLESYCDT